MVSIVNLSVMDSLQDADAFVIGSIQNGDARKIPAYLVAQYVFAIFVNNLPTVLPVDAGVLWNNGGTLCIS